MLFRVKGARPSAFSESETISKHQMEEPIPQTEQELEQWMKTHCYNFLSYSINGNSIAEGFGIEKKASDYHWYYTERGHRKSLKVFSSEEEIVAYAFEQIQADSWARAHCIGFTFKKEEHMDLAYRLKELKLDFSQDQIPYYGPEQPVYRTFVFACDHRKVQVLKDRFYKK